MEIGKETYVHVVVLLLPLLVWLKSLVVRAVLCVLRVLGMEIVKSICHDVTGVHGLSKGAGDGLHGDIPASWLVAALSTKVGGDREGKLHSNGSKEHLNTDQEVLVASRDSSYISKLGSIIRYQSLNDSNLFQNGQHNSLPE